MCVCVTVCKSRWVVYSTLELAVVHIFIKIYTASVLGFIGVCQL